MAAIFCTHQAMLASVVRVTGASYSSQQYETDMPVELVLQGAFIVHVFVRIVVSREATVQFASVFSSAQYCDETTHTHCYK
jgi:hypothetical protein